MIDDEENTYKTLKHLSNYGVSIAIDDFGTGYASLSCLRKIPINILKVDKSFVQDCDSSKESASIIAAIVMMAKSLKLKTVAEGVETEAHLNLLSKLGLDEIQGYFYSKPLPADQVIGFVKKIKKNKVLSDLRV